MAKLKTGQQVKADFVACGDTIHAWAIRNGFDPSETYRVINGYNKATKGKGFEIAVALGMKSKHSTTYPNFA